MKITQALPSATHPSEHSPCSQEREIKKKEKGMDKHTHKQTSQHTFLSSCVRIFSCQLIYLLPFIGKHMQHQIKWTNFGRKFLVA